MRFHRGFRGGSTPSAAYVQNQGWWDSSPRAKAVRCEAGVWADASAQPLQFAQDYGWGCLSKYDWYWDWAVFWCDWCYWIWSSCLPLSTCSLEWQVSWSCSRLRASSGKTYRKVQRSSHQMTLQTQSSLGFNSRGSSLIDPQEWPSLDPLHYPWSHTWWWIYSRHFRPWHWTQKSWSSPNRQSSDSF